MSDTPASAPAETAFRCPTCETKLVVYKSHAAAAGLMVRFRKCRRCDYRVRTREVPEKVIDHKPPAESDPPGCPSAPLSGG